MQCLRITGITKTMKGNYDYESCTIYVFYHNLCADQMSAHSVDRDRDSSPERVIGTEVIIKSSCTVEMIFDTGRKFIEII